MDSQNHPIDKAHKEHRVQSANQKKKIINSEHSQQDIFFFHKMRETLKSRNKYIIVLQDITPSGERMPYLEVLKVEKKFGMK